MKNKQHSCCIEIAEINLLIVFHGANSKIIEYFSERYKLFFSKSTRHDFIINVFEERKTAFRKRYFVDVDKGNLNNLISFSSEFSFFEKDGNMIFVSSFMLGFINLAKRNISVYILTMGKNHYVVGQLNRFLVAIFYNVFAFHYNFLILHASAVRMKDGIIAFLGQSAAGKTTLMKLFPAADLFCDDRLIVKIRKEVTAFSTPWSKWDKESIKFSPDKGILRMIFLLGKKYGRYTRIKEVDLLTALKFARRDSFYFYKYINHQKADGKRWLDFLSAVKYNIIDFSVRPNTCYAIKEYYERRKNI